MSDEKKRQQKRVVVSANERGYSSEWPPTDASECVAWFARKLEAIPPEYRESAKVVIDSISDYEDSHNARIEIYYYRPETDDEMAAREEQERLANDAQMAWELRTLRELKAKYEQEAGR